MRDTIIETVPFLPALSLYLHEKFFIDLRGVPSTQVTGETTYVSFVPSVLGPRRGDNDIGNVFEYTYADGTKEIKHDYKEKQ